MCIANILHGLVPKRVKKLHLNTFLPRFELFLIEGSFCGYFVSFSIFSVFSLPVIGQVLLFLTCCRGFSAT